MLVRIRVVFFARYLDIESIFRRIVGVLMFQGEDMLSQEVPCMCSAYACSLH
jgi:hypothetical protein